MALIDPRYIDCVVAIGVPNGKDVQWIGSGCILGHPDGGTSVQTGEPTYQLWLVSNRHVLLNRRFIVVGFNPESGKEAKNIACPMHHKGTEVVHYYSLSDPNPDRANVDLAVAPLRHQVLNDQGAKFSCFRTDIDAANLAKMAEIQLHEGDSVFVLGYPLALTTPEGNPRGIHYPLVRGGVVSRVRDLLDIGKGKFFIDTSNFPGNSGGPVILKPEIVSIQGSQAQVYPYLLGLVSAYMPHYTNVLALDSSQNVLRPLFFAQGGSVTFDENAGPALLTTENSGLAVVEPIDYAIDLIVNYPHKDIGYEYQNSK